MNPIDEFALLLPADDETPPDLDAIWQRVTESEPSDKKRRRRWVPPAAAAALIAGVVGIGVVSDGPAPVPSVADTVTSTLPPVSSSTLPAESVDSIDMILEAGAAPHWGTTADGWALTDFQRIGDASTSETVELYAGPEGLDTSWVAIARGVSEPFVRAGDLPATDTGDNFDTDQSISSASVATSDGTLILVAAGVPLSEARAVLDAVDANSALPGGFVRTQSSFALEQSDQYRFEHTDGRFVIVEVSGGGIPRADLMTDSLLDAVVVRTGFWVTRMTPSNPDLDPTEVVTEVSSNEWKAATLGLSEIPRLAIGDIVMLGAADELLDAGFVVDAQVSRSFGNGAAFVVLVAEQGRLPDTLVLHLGTNGPINSTDLADVMAVLVDVDQVVMLNTAIDRDWAAGNNALIESLPEQYANVTVLDWAALKSECPGDCFETDGFHLRPDGSTYYVELVEGVTK